MVGTLLAAAFECANVAVPEASEQAMNYYRSGNVLWILSQAWSLIVPLLILATGLSALLGRIANKWGKNWYFTIVAYLVLFFAITQLLNLPLDFYSGYIREHEYGLSNQTFGRWLGNYGKGFLVALITAAVFIWVFYLLLKKSPRRWWFYSSLASSAILFIMMFIQPIWIDPLFNKFSPMKNKEMEGRILHLASRAGIENGRVFEVDKSQDTKMINAYVVGFGKTNRIVLWDTTIQQLTANQILFVMGHEMGHYVLHHIWWQLAYFAALSFAIFYLTYRSANFLMRRYQSRFGFVNLSNIASLPLLLLLIGFFLFLSNPLSNFVSRVMEHQADRFGLEITQNNQAAGEAFLILQQQNLANPRPGPIYKFWCSSHPSLGDRIDFCNHYCPWKQQQPLKYGKYFDN
jgi:Zn-dependent protease with chaperone function